MERNKRKRGAHVSIIFSKGKMSGVLNKIEQFSRFFKKNDVDVYVLNRDFDGVINDVIYINYDNGIWPFVSRFFRYGLLNKYINFDVYDFVILRYPLFDFSAVLFGDKLKKVFLEHNTVETNELLKSGFTPVLKYIQYFSELLFAPIFLRKCLGHISVTSQISDYQKKRFNETGKFLIFSNGITVDHESEVAIELSDACFIPGSVSFVFIASDFQSWHGLDRLINSLERYTGQIKLVVNIIGLVSTELMLLINRFNNKHVSLITHGVKKKDETRRLIYSSDIGIDSLGLDRIGFTVSSTLKSKEYVLYSKPFISSVPDQDLISYENDLWFKVTFNEGVFDVENVLNWYFSREVKAKSFSLEKLTWEYKVALLLKEIRTDF